MQAVLNVRMDSVLKERGDKVLSDNGISVSDAVRALWAQLANTRALPDFLKDAQGNEDAKQLKREALNKLMSISDNASGNAASGNAAHEKDLESFSLEDIYDEMWAKYEALK